MVFCEQLHAIEEIIHEGEILIMMGNLNAKAGSENILLGYDMGKYGLGNRKGKAGFGNRKGNDSSSMANCSDAELTKGQLSFS